MRSLYLYTTTLLSFVVFLIVDLYIYNINKKPRAIARKRSRIIYDDSSSLSIRIIISFIIIRDWFYFDGGGCGESNHLRRTYIYKLYRSYSYYLLIPFSYLSILCVDDFFYFLSFFLSLHHYIHKLNSHFISFRFFYLFDSFIYFIIVLSFFFW